MPTTSANIPPMVIGRYLVPRYAYCRQAYDERIYWLDGKLPTMVQLLESLIASLAFTCYQTIAVGTIKCKDGIADS